MQRQKKLRNFTQKGNILRKLYAELRKVDLLYAHFTQLYAALRTLREAKTLYANLRTWQLADEQRDTSRHFRDILIH